MSIYTSNRNFDEFLNEASYRKYEQYRSDQNAQFVFEWLRERIDWLITSIRNFEKPALQGVIVDLEELLRDRFGWSKENKDDVFIRMIGSMVCYLVEEHGFSVKESKVPLSNNTIITTATSYERK
jgi:hypothetical protein